MGLLARADARRELRRDDIGTVGLYKTVARAAHRHDARGRRHADQLLGVFEPEDALERARAHARSACAPIASTSTCAATSPPNSGSANDSIVSPKFSLILGPWSETEFFVNVGKGFHSNDARGTTIRVDPTDGVTPADRVDPLVDALGADVGVRTAVLPQRAADRVAVDAEARFGAAVRRRRRHHRSRAARASGAASRPARSGIRCRG